MLVDVYDDEAFIKSWNMRDNYESLELFKPKQFVTLYFGDAMCTPAHL